MKLSTRTQYGTILILYLALRYGKGPVLLRDVAVSEGISEKYLGQIVIALKAAGLVKSFRGPHGGYILAKPLKTVTMLEVVQVLEGTADLIGYEKSLVKNNHETVVVSRNLWQTLSQQFNESLSKVTLADLNKECLERQETSGMYYI